MRSFRDMPFESMADIVGVWKDDTGWVIHILVSKLWNDTTLSGVAGLNAIIRGNYRVLSQGPKDFRGFIRSVFPYRNKYGIYIHTSLDGRSYGHVELSDGCPWDRVVLIPEVV